MRIGVDIDNTLNNLTEAIAKQLDIETGLSTRERLYEVFWMEDVVGWSADQVSDFFDRNCDRIFNGADIKDRYTLIALQCLALRHNQIHIVTNRNPKKNGYDIQQMTKEWVEKNNLTPYVSSIHFAEECKYHYCRENKLHVDVMVEDSVERAASFLSAGVPVILFDYKYNQDFSHKLLYRVKDWWEAFQKLVEIETEVKGRYESVNHYI